MAAIPAILKGDDSGAITLALDSSHDYTDATLVFAYQGVTRTFTDLVAGGSVNVIFTHAETENFKLGTYPIEMRLIGAAGAEETVSNAEERIKVTDCLAEVNSGSSFSVTPGSSSGVQITDVGDLPERYTQSQLAEKINALVRALAGRTVATMLAACVTAHLNGTYGATAHTCVVSNLWNDAVVVTNVDFDAAGLSRADVREEIESVVGPTNTVLHKEVDPTVPEWAKSETPPESMPGNGVTLTNGTLKTKEGTAVTAANVSGAQTASDVSAAIANAGHLTKSAADAAYYPKSQGEAWSAYWDGDDVRVTVTNYDSSTHLPALYLEQRTNETALATNLFRTVWREKDRWDEFLGATWDWEAGWGGFQSWATNVTDALAEKADRAWGYYDSHTGQYAPDGYTVVSSPHVMLASGMSYQKTVTTSAEVWILTANEPYEPTGVADSGGFQVRDSDGNVQMEIIKGDKVTVAAQPNAVATENATPATELIVTYNITAAAHPTAEICLDLETADWKTEDDSDCAATVTWTGSSGAWVATIAPKTATTKCFCRATYQKGGDTYINNRCAVGLSQIVLNGTTYNLGTATIDGNTVLTLTPAN